MGLFFRTNLKKVTLDIDLLVSITVWAYSYVDLANGVEKGGSKKEERELKVP